MDNSMINSIVEALVMASPEPLPAQRIVQVIEGATLSAIAKAVDQLNSRYTESGSSFRIREIAGGYQLHILPDYIGYIEELFTRRRKLRLSRAALETVAIVAYRQPVTKTEIEHIRGVAADGVLQNLLEKNLVTITGRSATVGRPLQYGTTDEFLKFFGLSGLDALPKMEEIEEMLAAAQPKSQVELPLPHPPVDPNAEVKLNIADGTFDPARAAALDDAVAESPDNGGVIYPERTTIQDSTGEVSSGDELDGLLEPDEVAAEVDAGAGIGD
ncbi:MAG TPA: SMC-Scp complex subunit ScpB [Candidatus Acidoferrum sp.]|nr:SMC-Scp complex subunit ScpB [Candidatus Acidoferrum sp.]